MDDQLKLLLQTCLSDEYLYCDIYSRIQMGFSRSYTVSLIALILQFANSHYFCTEEDIEEIKNKLITYTNLETDFRGYIENKGWAHCLAHVSDAFTEIVHNTYTTFEWYEELIHCLLNKIFIPSDLFIITKMNELLRHY